MASWTPWMVSIGGDEVRVCVRARVCVGGRVCVGVCVCGGGGVGGVCVGGACVCLWACGWEREREREREREKKRKRERERERERESWGFGKLVFQGQFLHQFRFKILPKTAEWHKSVPWSFFPCPPSTVVKQRLQMANSPFSSVWRCVLQTWQVEGVAAFYRSYTTQLTMNIPFQSTNFVVYEAVRRRLNPSGHYNPQVRK